MTSHSRCPTPRRWASCSTNSGWPDETAWPSPSTTSSRPARVGLLAGLPMATRCSSSRLRRADEPDAYLPKADQPTISRMNASTLIIAGTEFSSRLFVGTGKYSSGAVMAESLAASGTQLVTVALRRMDTHGAPDNILAHLDRDRYRLMPNTSGVRNAKEAVLAAELARDALETNWAKLEIHPDPKYLMPDPIETLEAARDLVKRGFIVLPYVHADPVLCKQLEEAGCAAVMPLGAPIGSNRGLESRAFLEIIIAQSN